MEKDLEPFVGRWELVRSENFAEFLKEMGFGAFFRKMACISEPITDIKIEGETAIISILVSRFYTNVQKIKLNEEFEQLSEKIPYKFRTEFENGRFTVYMDPVDPKGKGKKQVIHREIIGKELVMTIHVNNITCVRAYVKEGTKSK